MTAIIIKTNLISNLNFWDEAWWFLSFEVFGLLCLHLYDYILDVLADVSFGLHQVLLVELGSLQGTSNHVLYLIHSEVSRRTPGRLVIGVGSLSFQVTIIWKLEVQSWLQASNRTGILSTCTWLWLLESEQATLVSWLKCHWPDLKVLASSDLNSLKTST